jgi:release factor glutamine methyltransferase
MRASGAKIVGHSIDTALSQAYERLLDCSDTPRLDAEILLSHLLRRSRAFLRAWPEHGLTSEQASRFEAMIQRRAAGEPVAYLPGTREFWSLDLKVTPDTLIPRPETERLVELVLERLPVNQFARVADLGTGTGAVALAIAGERPRCEVVATDRSGEALAVARGNSDRLGLTNVRMVQGDWCAALTNERFHVIASNPPYVRDDDPHLVRGDVRFEPRTALAAGADGLDHIRRIAAEALDHLIPGGWLLLEHGFDQGEAVASILRRAGYSDVTAYTDMGGRDRVSSGRMR